MAVDTVVDMAVDITNAVATMNIAVLMEGVTLVMTVMSTEGTVAIPMMTVMSTGETIAIPMMIAMNIEEMVVILMMTVMSTGGTDVTPMTDMDTEVMGHNKACIFSV